MLVQRWFQPRGIASGVVLRLFFLASSLVGPGTPGEKLWVLTPVKIVTPTYRHYQIAALQANLAGL